MEKNTLALRDLYWVMGIFLYPDQDITYMVCALAKFAKAH